MDIFTWDPVIEEDILAEEVNFGVMCSKLWAQGRLLRKYKCRWRRYPVTDKEGTGNRYDKMKKEKKTSSAEGIKPKRAMFQTQEKKTTFCFVSEAVLKLTVLLT
jgi:hypothetical protein